MNSPTYIHKCEVCMASSKKYATLLLNKDEIEILLHSIFLKDFTTNNLPTTLYLKIARTLEESLHRGFGVSKDELDIEKVSKMRRNVYYFSAAKTYTLIKELEKSREGETYDKFKTKGNPLLTDFLGSYLITEKDHSRMAGRSGKRWVNSTRKHTPPYFEYVTKKDNRVRPAHQYLDGIIRRQDDNFWNTFMPPNGWNCRCKIKSYPKGENTSLVNFDKEEAFENVPVMFRMNFGKEGIVFPYDHPYFKNADKELARKNFNLPLPYSAK